MTPLRIHWRRPPLRPNKRYYNDPWPMYPWELEFSIIIRSHFTRHLVSRGSDHGQYTLTLVCIVHACPRETRISAGCSAGTPPLRSSSPTAVLVQIHASAAPSFPHLSSIRKNKSLSARLRSDACGRWAPPGPHNPETKRREWLSYLSWLDWETPNIMKAPATSLVRATI